MKNLSFAFEEVIPQLVSQMSPVQSDSGFALPEATLSLLGSLVSGLEIRRVFEFGSGRSTKVFLAAGCQVTCLESSAHWLKQTLQEIPGDSQQRVVATAQPLETVWHGVAPLRSWKLTDQTRAALSTAELILIDSPPFPPFREHALIHSLLYATQAILVIDDANIPTIGRFCRRISRLNPHLSTFWTEKDHGLFFFGKADVRPLRFQRGLIETGKMWRRFIAGWRAA